MKSISFRVPELPPNAEHVFAGGFGVATFLNDEVLTAEPDDAFSYCESDEYQGFVFKEPFVMEPLPISALPEFHSALPADTYRLGIFWEFPYLLRLRYETVTAGAISAFSATLPFGIASLTAITIVSPMLAYLLFDPPKTLIHSIFLAPVLSATCNSV